MSTFLKEIKQWLASSSFIGCIEWSNDKMFSSYFIEHFYGLPVYFLGFDFFLLYLCIVFSNKAIRRQKKFTLTREIYIRDCGGRRTTLWRVSQVFVAPATIVYDVRHKPDIVNLFSHFCWYIFLFLLTHSHFSVDTLAFLRMSLILVTWKNPIMMTWMGWKVEE